MSRKREQHEKENAERSVERFERALRKALNTPPAEHKTKKRKKRKRKAK